MMNLESVVTYEGARHPPAHHRLDITGENAFK